MSISELISVLQGAMATHGDISVALADWGENYAPPHECETLYFDRTLHLLVLDVA